ncbi:hypothetical protein BGX28_004401 [Mortierella sp. GBA30]|nr:hypothetical protein BGX28_004401 [Mortierella sp. GBA30]
MASTTRRQPLPQLRIIQQEFTLCDKRKGLTSEDDDDNSRGGSSEPATKIRKKPGRKPNPASPAVRKEQNRAAQRAFRDRKERHLQEMESTIKELKETNAQITLRLQQESKRFKSSLQTLQSENYYLREVVFSFESALSKDDKVSILQEVKAELYRRHYEKHSAKRLTSAGVAADADTESPDMEERAVPAAFASFAPNGCIPPRPSPDSNSYTAQEQVLNQAASTPSTTSSKSTQSSLVPTVSPSLESFESIKSSSQTVKKAVAAETWNSTTTKPQDREDHALFSMNNDILYKAPSFITTIFADCTKAAKPMTPMEYLSISRQSHAKITTPPKRRTEYTKQATVFDELQSSLFPRGTLQSIINTSMATPQEIVNDLPLLDQLYNHRTLRDPVIAPLGQNTFTVINSSSSPVDTSSCPVDSPLPSFLDEDNNDFRIATTLGLDDGLKQDVIPSKRLQLEIRVLASAPPAVDVNIDPKIYALPHDTRIDLIPCPKLRAQMILHQNKFDIEDLCQLLINGAKCHGHPLDPHSWELPEVFFDRFGFLLGQEMLRHRNKIWPKKDEPMPEASKAH